MGDKQVGKVQVALQISNRLPPGPGWITSRAEMGSSQDDQFRSKARAPGNADALPLPAGKLVR